jgi:hypothetical protein
MRCIATAMTLALVKKWLRFAAPYCACTKHCWKWSGVTTNANTAS